MATGPDNSPSMRAKLAVGVWGVGRSHVIPRETSALSPRKCSAQRPTNRLDTSAESKSSIQHAPAYMSIATLRAPKNLYCVIAPASFIRSMCNRPAPSL
jgi:hypothetical protein